METPGEEFRDIASLVLPQGILEYFTIVQINQTEDALLIYLNEQNVIPQEYIKDKFPWSSWDSNPGPHP